MDTLEIEVKFHIADVSPMRERILELGSISKGRTFETNIRFEDENKTLMKKGSLLRLRQDAKARLTFKSTPPATDNQFKVRRELEVEVSDFPTMNRIIESLGFHKEQIYEKWRETFVLNDAIFCIDTMPYGNFLEIEGQKEDIPRLAHAIGLKWEKRILANYLGIFGVIRRRLGLSFSDLTFDNFEDVEMDIRDYVHLFEAKTPWLPIGKS